MKYMGSKSRVAKYIVPIIQNYIDENNITTYVEPFVGGGNVIDKVKCENKYGFDCNKYLIALLKRVQKGLPLLDKVPRDLYNQARDCYNNQLDTFEDWELGNIGFLASYNGRFFDGGYAKSGYEKTKNGLRYRDYYKESLNNLLVQSVNLRNISFGYKDFSECNYYNNALIYCDPPYQNQKKYDLTKPFNYELFWQTIREWSENNIVLVSELNAPDDFECIWGKPVNRSIKVTDKKFVTEKLFKYKG